MDNNNSVILNKKSTEAPRFPKCLRPESCELIWTHTTANSNQSTNHHVYYSWTISNYSLLDHTVGKSIESIFSSKKDNTLRWYLSLYPAGFDPGYEDYISVMLGVFTNETFVIEGSLYFSVLNKNNEEVYRTDRIKISNTTFDIGSCPEFLLQQTLYEERDDLIVNDSLTIACSINYSYHATNKLSEKSGRISSFDSLDDHIEYSPLPASTRLPNLFRNMTLSDLVFKVEGKELRAHKCIVADSSPVFASMIKDEEKPKNNNKPIVIHDFDYGVMKQVLTYIYTDTVENLTGIADKLIVAAEKYQLYELKLLCESYLAKNLNVDNVFNTLLVADQHNGKLLKKATMTFISSRKQDFLQTEEFKQLQKSNIDLFMEVLYFVALNAV